MNNLKKIGILTINDNNNYGNRLQNYALQLALKKLGIESETIVNNSKSDGKSKTKITRRIINKIKRDFGKKSKLRKQLFNNFNKNILFSEYCINRNNIPKKLNEQFDYFITGSDQVWNCTYDRFSSIDFLEFASKEKRISYAASFGISNIPDEMKENYSKWLQGMNYISVREDRGKEIIKEITGREDVKVLIDPTMLLTTEQWDFLSKKPQQFRGKKYILNYFLGEMSKEVEREIKRIAKENGCEIINLLDKKGKFYATGPSEFIFLEKNAFLVCTDSFHSVIFAMLYNKPFIIFNRKQSNAEPINSRIDTLLNKFKMTNRIFNGKITNNLLNIDYKEFNIILIDERKKSYVFLKKALNLYE